MNMTATMARASFLDWLKTNHPAIYREAAREVIAPQLSGFMDTLSDTFKKFTDAVPKLAETYVTTKAQLDAIKLNIERAKAGQYPIDPLTGQIYSTNQPAPVDIAMARDSGPSPWLILGGAVILFMLLRR